MLFLKVPTPAYQCELQHVSAQVGCEHTHNAQVHVQGLKSGPGEWRQ